MDLVEATEISNIPIFSRDIETSIDVINQTLTYLVGRFDAINVEINDVSLKSKE